MRRILHIDASYSGESSVSRVLSGAFIAAWQKFHTEDTILYRDLGHFPVPYINETWIAAIHSPPETHTPEMVEALKVSNPLLEEFLSVDGYVFGVPMYGFTIPATLKAYIEHLIRVGQTYEVNENGVQGLVQGKKLCLSLLAAVTTLLVLLLVKIIKNLICERFFGHLELQMCNLSMQIIWF